MADERARSSREFSKGFYHTLTCGQTRTLLDTGFFITVRKTLRAYDGQQFGTYKEAKVEGYASKVDYVALVNKQERLLLEVKSPTVMMKLDELLPENGFELEWEKSKFLVRKVLGNVSTRISSSYNVVSLTGYV
jgi:hypothetical protein